MNIDETEDKHGTSANSAPPLSINSDQNLRTSQTEQCMDHNTHFKQIYHTPFTQRSQSMLPQKYHGKDKANLSL